ncbi:DUF1217 domain-containing protein [Yoonia sediminilitoris]|uniref:Uncharacterized protein DUF1217 n=1 Tax=Yoonia sediminilitoris TaxID=1286148 RepID=A0A2T6KAB3_9RHOB|nr:DUF1217 domain-containing protein [Yoonia sediminilitoris]PUB11785.1 uncharacterized protein DUF1217 [Yoonia sediminilitoris]RCW91862.1 uncharacterized protein DUF1217 [Yoonia sediminilitoris]
MSFQPVVPLTGYVGWRFLDRTIENQQKAFDESQPVVRATDYFREKIAGISTAEELVDDRRLLEVALGAFGLDDDINNKFFIKTILEEGTVDDEALANRLTDPRYRDLTAAFGFGENAIPNTILEIFSEEIISRYEDRQFEKAVGEQNNDLRLALNLENGLADILDNGGSNNAFWFSIMGNPPLRSVFQTALGLPQSIATIDVDKQREIFQERSQSIFGTDDLSDFTDPEQQEKLIRLFLIRSEAQSQTFTGGSTALTLLQSVPSLF